MRHALTFDVEDWFHLDGIPAVEDRSAWHAFPSLVERRTNQFLRLCDEAGILATFFILGWVADRRPRLVRRIVDTGHEVATHGFWHRRIRDVTRDAFVRDLVESIDVLRAQGADVAGFRAPCFSLGPHETWVYDVLCRLGLSYDSSKLARRGGHETEGPHLVRTANGHTIAELPVSRVGVGPFRVRFSGGGYLRLLPLVLVEAGIERERRAGRPTVMYLHPRDLAPDCPRVPMPLVRRMRTYANLDSTVRKLTALVSRHEFGPCGAIVDDMLSGSPRAERR